MTGGGPDDDAPDDAPTATAAGDDPAGETLSVTGDDLAGVVDLFGGLAREDLRRALAELAFKRGVDAPPETLVDDAVAAYRLVAHDGLLVAGPTAFPTLPEGAADLPHILDIDRASPPADAVAETAERRFREEAAQTLANPDGADGDAVARLVDVSYDLEAWGPVEVGDVRRRLDDVGDEGGE